MDRDPQGCSVSEWRRCRASRHFPIPSCQDLILASPGTNLADVMKLLVEAAMNADAGRYQGQALV